MPLSWLFAWWNAIYAVPLTVVLIVLTVTAVVGLAGGALGGDGVGGTDAAVETDVDLDVALEAGSTAPHTHASAAHTNGHADPPPWMGALLLLGAGKAPVLLVLQVFTLFWGIFGLGIHQAVHASGPGVLLGSVPATLLLSLLATRGAATLLGKFYRPVETASLRRSALVGLTGQVVYPVTSTEGTVNVRDPHGTLHRIRARTEYGQLEAGRKIIVLGYDPERSLYQVDDATAFVDRS